MPTSLFNSKQVGSSPSLNYVLKTDGSVSVWVDISTLVPSDTDTLSTVTGRGATTSTKSYFNGGLATKDLILSGNYSYTYNVDGTLATKTDTSTGRVETFSYNGDGTLASKTDTINIWTYSYNVDGTLLTKIVT